MSTENKPSTPSEPQSNPPTAQEDSPPASTKDSYPPDHWVHEIVRRMRQLDPNNMPDTP